MRLSKNLKIVYLLLLTSMLIFVGALYVRLYAKNQDTSEQIKKLTIDGVVLPKARVIDDFSLTDNHSTAFTKKSLKHHWTLMFFGFTNCAYVCPLTLAELNKMYSQLKTAVPPQWLPEIVMVSVDPERDSVKRMDQYVSSFNKAFIGLQGSISATHALADQMSVVYNKVFAPNGDYSMNHSAEVMLLNPEGNLQAFFSYPHKADVMAKDYKAIMQVFK